MPDEGRTASYRPGAKMPRMVQPQGLVSPRLDLSNPFARGLAACVVYRAGSFYELVTNQIFLLVAGTSGLTERFQPLRFPGNPVASSAFVTNSNAAYQLTNRTPAEDIVGGFSALFEHGIRDLNDRAPLLWSIARGTDSTGFEILADEFNGLNTVGVGINAGASNTFTLGDHALGANSENFFHRSGFSVDGTNYRGYVNGSLNITTAGTLVPSAATGRRLGLNSDAGARSGTASLGWAYIWNRVLSDNEFANISRAPYQLFAPIPNPTFLQKRQTWSHRSSRMLGTSDGVPATAAIITSKKSLPWTVQPQGRRPRLNKAHPLGGALNLVWIGNDLSGIDAETGLAISVTANTVLARRSQGLAAENTNTAGTLTSIPSITTFPYIQVAYGYFSASAATYQLDNLTHSGGFTNSGFFLDGANQVSLYVRWAGTQRTLPFAITGASTGVPICGIAQFFSATDYRAYVNGTQVNGTLSPGTLNLNQSSGIAASLTGGVFLRGYGTGRTISDADALSITRNPQGELWQLFASPTKPIWTPSTNLVLP